MCARQPAARGGWGRTCQRRMCVLFALILGTARGAPQRGAERGAAGLFSQIDRKGSARPVSVRAVSLPPPPQAGGGRGHSPLPCVLPAFTVGPTPARRCRERPGGDPQTRWRAAPFRHGPGGPPLCPKRPSLSPPPLRSPRWVCHTVVKGRPGRKPTWTGRGSSPGALAPRGHGHRGRGTIRSAGPLDTGPGDHEVTLPVRRSPFPMLK